MSAYTHKSSFTHTHLAAAPHPLPTPGRKVERLVRALPQLYGLCLLPRGTAPEPPRLRWAPSRGTRPPRGPLTSPTTPGRDWSGPRWQQWRPSLHPGSGSWLVFPIRHKRGSLPALSFPNPRENLFYPPKWPTCALRFLPSAPCPRPLQAVRAGPLPGDRASRFPSQWGVGKGRVGGEEREEVGKRGCRVFQGGRGAVLFVECLPVLLRGKPTSQQGSNFPSPWPG